MYLLPKFFNRGQKPTRSNLGEGQKIMLKSRVSVSGKKCSKGRKRQGFFSHSREMHILSRKEILLYIALIGMSTKGHSCANKNMKEHGQELFQFPRAFVND